MTCRIQVRGGQRSGEQTRAIYVHYPSALRYADRRSRARTRRCSGDENFEVSSHEVILRTLNARFSSVPAGSSPIRRIGGWRQTGVAHTRQAQFKASGGSGNITGGAHHEPQNGQRRGKTADHGNRGRMQVRDYRDDHSTPAQNSAQHGKPRRAHRHIRLLEPEFEILEPGEELPAFLAWQASSGWESSPLWLSRLSLAPTPASGSGSWSSRVSTEESSPPPRQRPVKRRCANGAQRAQTKFGEVQPS